MKNLNFLGPLALAALPFLSFAQAGPTGLVGLELPAPAPPVRGHFLTGAYVMGSYTPLPTTASYGYGVQPFLRYQMGSSASGRPRPYVQYTFTSYRMASYATGPLYGPEGAGLSASSGFAPLGARNVPAGYNSYGNYGGLGAFSVGIPMRIGNGSAVLSVGGELVGGLLRGVIDPRSTQISPLGPYWGR